MSHYNTMCVYIYIYIGIYTGLDWTILDCFQPTAE